jgi:UDP-N-acetyl-D-glucosamine dehydrogenase
MQPVDIPEAVRRRACCVGVVGLGYVGLPRALRFAAAGHQVVGFDVDAHKVAELQAGRSYIHHIPSPSIAAARRSGRMRVTTHMAEAAGCHALLLCVPTPLQADDTPDLQFVVQTATALGPHLRRGQLIVLESTTYPGTTQNLLKDTLEAHSGLQVGADLHLAYSPERDDPGRTALGGSDDAPKVVSGHTPAALEQALALYRAVYAEVVIASCPRAAEMSKLFENVFRSVNIALVNELKMIADAMQLDVWEIVRLAATKPFGFMPFWPGPGTGGHCIPVDPLYLSHCARAHGMPSRFIELAASINRSMPNYVLQRLQEALGKVAESPAGPRILLMGVAYKKGVDDMREAPAYRLIELLQAANMQVDYHDPFVPVLPRSLCHALELRSVALTAAQVSSYDAVVVVTDHAEIDYAWLGQHARLVVDTRHAVKRAKRLVRA